MSEETAKVEETTKPADTAKAETHKSSRRKLSKRAIRRIVVGVVVLTFLFAGVSFVSSGVFSAGITKNAGSVDEVVIATRSMSFWVDATGILRASSVRN